MDRAAVDIPGPAAKSIGRIGGGRNAPTGVVDVAIIQSLVKKGVVDDRVGGYGHLIVDECHHLSAHSFEQVARQAKARFVLGLSATVARKDGHHPIIFMQCGPVRHRVNAKAQAAARPFEHYALVRPTSFQSTRLPEADRRLEFQTLYRELVEDDARNRRICEDVIESLHNRRGRASRESLSRTDSRVLGESRTPARQFCEEPCGVASGCVLPMMIGDPGHPGRKGVSANR